MTRQLIAACPMLICGPSAAHHSPVDFNLDVTDFAVTGKIASVSFRTVAGRTVRRHD